LETEAPKIAFTCHPADPAMGTCKEAAAIGAHMIVLGAHEDSQKLSLGRVDYIGQTIMEKAPCPVMLVPHPAR
jgi:nucleotide-binding universal stress UspA family protein